MSTCPHCSVARTEADAAGLAWSSRHDADGSVSWACPTCTRALLWQIEGHLDLTPAPVSRAA